MCHDDRFPGGILRLQLDEPAQGLIVRFDKAGRGRPSVDECRSRRTPVRRWHLPLLLQVLGCGGTAIDYIPVRAPSHALQPKPAEKVQLYLTAPPKEPYTEVAILDGQQQRNSHDSRATVLRKMREAAGRLGCDGLLIVGANDRTVSTRSRPYWESGNLAGYHGVCLASGQPGPEVVPGPPVPPSAAEVAAACQDAARYRQRAETVGGSARDELLRLAWWKEERCR